MQKLTAKKTRLSKPVNLFVRSPTLDTVLMVEKKIEETSGEFNRTELWKNLPKKVMWQTFLVILDYLQTLGKIAVDREGHIAWIWDPEGVKKFLGRADLSWK